MQRRIGILDLPFYEAEARACASPFFINMLVVSVCEHCIRQKVGILSLSILLCSPKQWQNML